MELTHEEIPKVRAGGTIAVEDLVLGQRRRQREREFDVAAVTTSLVRTARLRLLTLPLLFRWRRTHGLSDQL